jgi:hypothetical protein
MKARHLLKIVQEERHQNDPNPHTRAAIAFISQRKPGCLTVMSVIEGHQRCALQFKQLW